MRSGLNRNRYRNFCIGLILACTFALWAFNIERIEKESVVEIIYEATDDGIEIYSHFEEPEPEPEPEKQPEPQKVPETPSDPFNFKLIQNFKPIQAPMDLSDLFNKTSVRKLPAPVKVEESPIELRPDELASFPGGKEKLLRFLERNVNYPDMCYELGYQGTVALKFIVDEKGNISNITVLKDEVGCGAASEAIRVMKTMPKWNPGTKRGNPVKSYFVQTFRFKIY